jgi:hypothetical protein
MVIHFEDLGIGLITGIEPGIAKAIFFQDIFSLVNRLGCVIQNLFGIGLT